MVTTLETKQVEVRQIPLEELGAALGIPIKVRPWWGSRIELPRQVHNKCGHIVYRIFGRNSNNWWCPGCLQDVSIDETELRQVFPRRWVCPAGNYYSNIKHPEIQRGVVILWAGPCREKWGARYHKHHQELEVLDVGETALLLKVSVYPNSSHFLIGLDDGHPYITPVPRKHSKVQDAFDWLVPNKVQEAMILGKDVKRQGDWFFIPTEEPKWWNHRKPVYLNEVGFLFHHKALCYGATQTRHTASLVVYKTFSGLPYPAPVVKGDVRVPDHPTLRLESWHIGIRTRTTPSVSQNNPGLD